MPAVFLAINEPMIMPQTVGTKRYANCFSVKPNKSIKNIGLASTYKKKAEKFAERDNIRSKNSLSLNILR